MLSAGVVRSHVKARLRIELFPLGTARLLHTSSGPVHLHFDKLVPPNGNETHQPLVILHGLFGTKRNWASLAKAFQKELGRPVYALDLRNHGTSPHATPMNYTAMAEDVFNFCKTHSLSNISLLGHSMGGKVAMTVALSPDIPSDLLSHLIVADIAPARGALSSEFQGYIEGMKKIEDSGVTSRQQADRLLVDYEKDPMTRAFLLMNLQQATAHHKKPLHFRIPVGLIGDNIAEMGSFPFSPGERSWEGPTLFVKGSKSKYINSHTLETAKAFFPEMTLETLEAGHWVHSEKPNEFKAVVTDFIKSH